MGGLEAATAAKVGGTLLEADYEVRKERSRTKKEQRRNMANAKNLVEEQMASRRAGLGAAGLVSSPSSDAVGRRLVGNAYASAGQANQDLADKYGDYLRGKQIKLAKKMIK